MGKEALVVKREILFKDYKFNGFISSDKFNFIPLILTNHFYYDRGDKLENDNSVKQIIPYVYIVNKKTKKVFAYRRADKQNYTEKRLQNKWSCGLGGHIERIDSENPIISGMTRELREEVQMINYPMPKIIGYLNYDSDSVGSVHFGLVAIAETEENVEKKDEEISHGQFYSVDELEKIFSSSENQVEEWTRYSWPFIKEYLSKL